MTDVIHGLRYFWYVLSVVIFVGLFLLFIIPEQMILHNLPTCESQIQYHKPCMACGMSRAFLALQDGKLKEAQLLNPFSAVLFSLLLMNELLFTVMLITRKQKSHHC